MDNQDSTSLHPQHDNFELSFTKQLESLGFVCVDLTYHSNMEQSDAQLLKCRYTETALYIRTRPDGVAMHKNYDDIVFQYEIKTHDSKKRHDWLIEMFPLCLNISHARDAGIRCLYVYHNRHTGDESAFWCTSPPPVREIYIPKRWDNTKLRNRFLKMAIAYFPGVPHRYPDATNGSDDPYVVIDHSILQGLPKWDVLLAPTIQAIKNREKTTGAAIRHNGIRKANNTVVCYNDAMTQLSFHLDTPLTPS